VSGKGVIVGLKYCVKHQCADFAKTCHLPALLNSRYSMLFSIRNP
jgi:hypothetical protein